MNLLVRNPDATIFYSVKDKAVTLLSRIQRFGIEDLGQGTVTLEDHDQKAFWYSVHSHNFNMCAEWGKYDQKG